MSNSMPKTVALQMDPIDGININADSSFALGLAAERRGAQLYHYLPTDLSLEDGRVMAHIRPLTLRREEGNHFTLGKSERINLSDIDVVLMRQDPPFDMAYITATHILEHLPETTLVLNNPHEVRNAPEKLYVTHFDGVMPPTLITRNIADVKAFRAVHKDIIIKPLYGNGGAGVFHVRPDDTNLGALVELFQGLGREPFIVQAYLPAVRKGDKRVILIDGEPVGALNRVPAVEETRSNLHVGGRAEAAELTPRDREICATLGPSLKAAGLVFVGIDIIGDYLTEINVTSPTGIQEIQRLGGPDIAELFWDAVERRRA